MNSELKPEHRHAGISGDLPAIVELKHMSGLIEYACKSQAAKLRYALTRLLGAGDDEAVHDVRVSCRRLQVALKIAQDMFRSRLIKAVRARVKALLDSLSEVRDSEVLAERARKLSEQNNDEHLARIATLFEGQTELGRMRAVAAAEHGRYWTMPLLIESLFQRKAFDRKGMKRFAKLKTEEEASFSIHDHYERVMGFEETTAESESESLHQLRIAMKKYRYAAEFFLPAVGEQVGPLIEAAQELQKVLGNLHDADVAEEKLSPWLRKRGPYLITNNDPAPHRREPAHGHMDKAFIDLLEAARQEQVEMRQAFAVLWTPETRAKLKPVFVL